MKKLTHLLSLPVITLAFALMPGGTAYAQVSAHDDAGAYNAAGNTWNNGDNRGFGFTPWVLDQTGTGGGNFTGFYIGNGDGISTTGSSSFGIYANGPSGTNMSVAYRGFSNSLATTNVFKLQWHNNGIGATGHAGGFVLRNGNATNTVFDYNIGQRFQFSYFGGGLDSYAINDGTGFNYINLPFGASPFTVQFTLIDANNYRFVVTDPSGLNVLYVTNNPLIGSGTIDSVALFNMQADGDQNFNNLDISSTSLVPPTIVNVFPANGTIFLDPTTNTISFEVDSVFSTVATNNISLTLNGVAKSNLFFTGTGTNRIVTLGSNTLVANLVYTNVIVATDANGNKATNISVFNTWSTNLLFIEAEDYNFNGGGFLSGGSPTGNITPNSYGVQSGNPLAGTNGIDYFKPTPNDGGSNDYRPGDLHFVDLDGPPVSADVDHNGFTSNGYLDYNLSFVEAGEWENYTRTFSTNLSYNVYARMASLSANPTMEIDRYAAPTAATTNAPLIPLGTAICPASTGGGQSYAFVPLTDFFSQPVLLRLTGSNTLRSKRLGGSYNFNYLIFVPNNVTNILRPYLSFGYPFPNATGVAVDTTISFNIANRQTSVTNGGVHVSLNSNDITGSLVLNTNAAGTLVTYTPPNLLPSNTTNTLVATVTDSGNVTMTNTWIFTTENPIVVPTAYAQPNPGTSNGFTIHIAKAADSAPASVFPATVARAELQLTTTLVDTNNNQPYPNLAQNGGQAVETNVINYDINALSFGPFGSNVAFPDVPAAPTNNYIAMEALMYVPLSNGVYTFAVNSDDGFKFTTGPTPSSTNLTLGIFDGDRPPTESSFDFIIQTNGYYPMRLLYFQGISGGNVELYSINRTNGTRILLNNPTNSAAFKTYQASSITRVVISISYTNGNVVLTWPGSHTLQSATNVNSTNSGFTDVAGPVLTGPYTNTPSGRAKYYRLKN